MADTEIENRSMAEGDASPEQYEYIEEVVEYRDTRVTRILLAAILVLLVLLLAYMGYRVYTAQAGQGGAVTTGSSNEMVWVQSIYNWGPAGDRPLIAPNTVTIDGDGLIWTNSNNRAAVAFNPDGSFDRVLEAQPTQASPDATGTSEATASASAPTVTRVFSLAADGAERMYVCDNAEGNIIQTSAEAGIQQVWKVPGVNKIAANDSRVVALTGGSLGVFDPETGEPYFLSGSRGPGPQQFDNPWGAHIDDENYVYVADTQNRRVRKFDPEGKLLWDAGTVPDRDNPESMDAREASADDLFTLPTGVTTDANGRVVVVDGFKYEVIVLDGETGEKIASYGDYGQADGLFDKPSAIAYDADRDWFVIADTDNNRLQIVRLPGSSDAAVQASLRRLFDRPVWICCFPFIILLIAAVVVATSRRRQQKAEEAAAAVQP